MKKIINILCILIFSYGICFGSNSLENIPVFEKEGLELFFKISDILKENRLPDEELWTQLFNTPGYKVLCEKEFKRDYLRDLMVVSFMPSKLNQKDSVIESYNRSFRYSTSGSIDIIKCFIQADKKRDDIITYIQNFYNRNYIEKIKSYLEEFLENPKIDSTIKISFIVFNDSRGYDPIVIGLSDPTNYSSYETECFVQTADDKYLPITLLVAHEIYHNVRDKRVLLSKDAFSSEDKTILKVLNDINNEGIADLINIEKLYEENGCLYHSEYSKIIQSEQYYQRIVISLLDYLISHIAQDNLLNKELSKIALLINSRSGHPLGYFIAKSILKYSGNEELRRVSINPFHFIYSYNDAAKKSKDLPVFSYETIEYLRLLEEKYYATGLSHD